MTFREHLEQHCRDENLRKCLEHLSYAFIEIEEALRKSKVEYSTSKNEFGETQLNMDIIADNILEKHLKESQSVKTYLSEERESPTHIQDSGLVVATDPIDGSSVAGASFAIGTSVGIWPQGNILDMTGRDQIGAIYAIYGTVLKLVYTTKNGTHSFILNDNEFSLEEENLKLNPEYKMCSIGGLQKAPQIPGYKDLIDYWIENGYKLRYSGSLTADFHMIVYKKGGVFTNPTSKLRLTFECCPFALITEQAGGTASNGKQDILDIPINSLEQEEPLIIGSTQEVETAIKLLNS